VAFKPFAGPPDKTELVAAAALYNWSGLRLCLNMKWAP